MGIEQAYNHRPEFRLFMKIKRNRAVGLRLGLGGGCYFFFMVTGVKPNTQH